MQDYQIPDTQLPTIEHGDALPMIFQIYRDTAHLIWITPLIGLGLALAWIMIRRIRRTG